MIENCFQSLAWISLLIMGLSACSDDDKRGNANSIFGVETTGPSDAAPPSSFCQHYCNALVDNAKGCEAYNDKGRCEEICKFYSASACDITWEAFASCMGASQQAECVLPEGGKLTLVISACHAEFADWDRCRVERDAGICRY